MQPVRFADSDSHAPAAISCEFSDLPLLNIRIYTSSHPDWQRQPRYPKGEGAKWSSRQALMHILLTLLRFTPHHFRPIGAPDGQRKGTFATSAGNYCEGVCETDQGVSFRPWRMETYRHYANQGYEIPPPPPMLDISQLLVASWCIHIELIRASRRKGPAQTQSQIAMCNNHV